MANPEIDKKIKVSPMTITNYPRKEHVVGEARNFINDFQISIESEQIYNVMGVNTDKSFLITGAPGNGKTMCIEALVNEVNKKEFNKFEKDKSKNILIKLIGLKYDTGKYGTAYINEGSKRVQTFFDICFAYANHGYKTLIIFDEADTIFGKRQERGGHKEDAKVLETIMKNMQILHDTDNLYSVMMSNFPEAFDKASIRSGRIDRRYEFKNPSPKERAFAFNHSINQINKKAGYKVVRGCDSSYLSTLSNEFSYSDINESVKSAVKLKAKEVSEKPRDGVIDLNIWINEKRIRDSIKQHKKTFVKNKSKKRIGFI